MTAPHSDLSKKLRNLAELFAVLALLAGCAAAVVVPSRWSADPPRGLSGLPAGDLQGLVVEAQNDQDYLYLRLATDGERLKSQLLGGFQQDLTIWFEPGDAKERGPGGRGLRIAIHRMPGVGYPRRSEEQKEYLKAATRQISLLGGNWDEGEQVLHPDGREIDLVIEMDKGRLAYSMKLPLRPSKGRSWAIGAGPGQNLTLVFACSRISQEAAELQLIREYQEQVYGWGWSTGPNPYGPKPEQDPRKSLALGDYGSKGLDKGIYARNNVYRPLSWASVPEPLYSTLTFKLAEQP